MEFVRQDFEASIPMLKKAIDECDFVAIDTEMTGLATPANTYKFPDSLQTRYSKVSISAAEFLVIQLGICTFTWSDKIGGYEARPFNFPCFPSSVDEAKAGERFFKCQSSSLEFLINNGFDFNKWIHHGIPYLTNKEEEIYLIRKLEKEAYIAAPSIIATDDRNREFIESTTAMIKEWVQTSTEEPLTVPAYNSYLRRLVYQIIRLEFNDEYHVTPNSQARTMTIQPLTDEIRRQKEEAKVPKPPTLNLRLVLDFISDANKPLIGHNCFLDFMQISQQFLWDLPLDLDEWKRSINSKWKTIIDTKHLATHPLISSQLISTGLEYVSENVQKPPFASIGPKVVMAEGFDRYQADASLQSPETTTSTSTVENSTGDTNKNKDTKYHEAGYDAYITGQAFLRFAGYILKDRENSSDDDEGRSSKRRKIEDDIDQSNDVAAPAVGSDTAYSAHDDDEVEEEEEGEVLETQVERDAFLERQKNAITDNPTKAILETEDLKKYYNMFNIMRSDIPVMNITGNDPEPEEKPWTYLLKNLPLNTQTSSLFALFSEFNPYRFNWQDGTNALITLSTMAPAREGEESTREAYEPTPLPLGRLGMDFVHPLCVGDGERAVKGRAAGIVPEAANIEVVSWRSWFEERQEQERQERQNREFAREQQNEMRLLKSGRGGLRSVLNQVNHKRVYNGLSVDSVIPDMANGTLDADRGTKRKHDSDDTALGIVAVLADDSQFIYDDELSLSNYQLRIQSFLSLLQLQGFTPRFAVEALAYIHYYYIEPTIRFSIAMIILDTWQYVLHRLFHTIPYLYKHFHSRHHRLIVTYPFGALYNHPFEGFMMDSVGASLAFLASGMGNRGALTFFSFSTLKTLDDHCGYNLPFNPLQMIFANNADYHDIHHQPFGFKKNFSQPFGTFWDYILGTQMSREEANEIIRKKEERNNLRASFITNPITTTTTTTAPSKAMEKMTSPTANNNSEICSSGNNSGNDSREESEDGEVMLSQPISQNSAIERMRLRRQFSGRAQPDNGFVTGKGQGKAR
ncbi:hypothetical protein BGZ76_000843 [Entomortierella beljakovae]|nr:hypothetical protein BGZ76_000843 [Entomortierella beljakovae]